MSSVAQIWLDRADVLGTVPDPQLAERYGVSRQRIHQVRQKLGISAFTEPIDWTDIDPLLGTEPDQQIAARLDICAQTIANRRRLLGIDRFRISDHPEYGRTDYAALLEYGNEGAPQRLGCSLSGITRRAQVYASRAGKRWPLVVCRTGSDGPVLSYQLWRETTLTWREIAKELGYKSRSSAQSAAYNHARRHNLPLPCRQNR